MILQTLFKRISSGITIPVRRNQIASILDDYNRELRINTVARTSITNPGDHTTNHVGMWYEIEQNKAQQIFGANGLARKHARLTELFQETLVMIRKPSIQVIDYVKKSNLDSLPNKFFFYGRRGSGKTMCLSHVTHFLFEERYILVTFNHVWDYIRNFNEILPSSQEGFYDHTVDAVNWLSHFKQQNGPLIIEQNLLTTQDYVWNVRESTKAGSPLMSLVDYALARSRYASQCINYLANELKILASSKKCKVAVLLDGINVFFHPSSYFIGEDRKFTPCNKFTFFNGFLKFLEPDWSNGIIIGTICSKASLEDHQDSYHPHYLLRHKGWETLDPFVPIKVIDYSPQEFDSNVDYYLEKNWLVNPQSKTQGGRLELEFLSSKNPLALYQLAKTR